MRSFPVLRERIFREQKILQHWKKMLLFCHPNLQDGVEGSPKSGRWPALPFDNRVIKRTIVLR